MNNIDSTLWQQIKVTRRKQEYCTCPLHRGQLVQQIEGTLPNGRFLVIVKDGEYWHLSIRPHVMPVVSGSEPDYTWLTSAELEALVSQELTRCNGEILCPQ